MTAEASDIGYLGLAASGILIVVAVVLSLRLRLGLERSLLWAGARAAVQLLLVGVALRLVLDPEQPIMLSWLWVVVMVAFAAWTTGRRAPEVPGIRLLTAAAFIGALVATFGVLFGLRVFEMGPRTIVPLGGMVVGNSISSTVLVGRRIIDTFRDSHDEIEARLALGLTGEQAGGPYLRDALRTVLIPQIETTKAVGIVFLPGAMVGLILAGVDPLDAVKVQAAVMYLVLGSVAVTTSVVALGLGRRLFTTDHRLVRLPPR